MFTGIIEGLGVIKAVRPSGQGKVLSIASDISLEGTKIGDSIAVNGACLTAVHLDNGLFQVDVSPETVQRTTFSGIRVGGVVNLERALRLSDRLDGHLVSGHIDGLGHMADRRIESNAIIIRFTVPSELARYIIPKGSVAVDGVSLTVNQSFSDGFEVSIIPHTAKLTTVGQKKVGDPVNIETDMIGKYVERFVMGGASLQKSASSIDMNFLAKNGIL